MPNLVNLPVLAQLENARLVVRQNLTLLENDLSRPDCLYLIRRARAQIRYIDNALTLVRQTETPIQLSLSPK